MKFDAPKPKPTGENKLRAVVLKVDRFGNLITNITPDDAPALFSGKMNQVLTVGGVADVVHVAFRRVEHDSMLIHGKQLAARQAFGKARCSGVRGQGFRPHRSAESEIRRIEETAIGQNQAE